MRGVEPVGEGRGEGGAPFGARPLAARAMLWAVVAASIYGVTDEVHQLFVPLRDSSWQDWFADTIGAAIGAAAARKLFGYRENRRSALTAASE